MPVNPVVAPPSRRRNAPCTRGKMMKSNTTSGSACADNPRASRAAGQISRRPPLWQRINATIPTSSAVQR